MSQTITGHFDGKVIIPEKPVKLPVGKRLRIQVELAVEPSNGKKPGKRRKIIGGGQFNSGKPDLATNKKHMEGFSRKSHKPIEILGTGQFESGIPDLGSNKKHLEVLAKK